MKEKQILAEVDRLIEWYRQNNRDAVVRLNRTQYQAVEGKLIDGKYRGFEIRKAPG